MKKIVYILLIACFCCNWLVKSMAAETPKAKVAAHSTKDKDTDKQQAQIDEAKTLVQSQRFDLSYKPLNLPSFQGVYYYVVYKTASKHLRHKILFENKYFHTLLRHFISPQAP